MKKWENAEIEKSGRRPGTAPEERNRTRKLWITDEVMERLDKRRENKDNPGECKIIHK